MKNKSPHSSTNHENSQLDYSFKELYYMFKSHKLIASIVFSTVFFIISYYTLIVKPIYQSSSTVMVRQDQKSMSIFSMLDMGLTKDRNYIQNEIAVLKSRTTLDVVIEELFKGEHKNNLFLFGTRKYKPQLTRKLLTFGIDYLEEDFELGDSLNDSLKIIFSDKLSKSLEISNKRNTDAIKISINSQSPIEAKIITNAIVNTYKDRDLNWLTAEMGHLKVFLTSQLKEKEKELNDIEEKLKNFQENEKVFGLEENSKLILENLTEVESRYNNVLAMIDINNHKIQYLNDLLTGDEKEFSERVSNTINDRLFALKNELAISESELISLQTQYGENHSAVATLNQKITILKTKLKDETRLLISQGIGVANPIDYRQGLMDSIIHFKTTKAVLESKAISYKNLVDSYDQELSSLPKKMLDYSRLERQRVIQAETFSFMSRKLEEARIGEASKLGKIRVIDHAIVDFNPISPNKIFNIALAIMLSSLCSIAAVFGLSYFDNTIKSIEYIERKGIPILSMIPDLNQPNVHGKSSKEDETKNPEKNKILERKLITYENPKSPVSEAYKSLRTSLLYSVNKGSSGQIISISSSGPGEGKTTTIANLAITYADLGKKTLLIDGDLRKSVLHKVFNFPKSPGFTSYLSNQSTLKDIVHKTDINNLYVSTAGVSPPNPSELLESDKLVEFINDIKNDYDIILIDTPPLIAVPDAYILMKYVNQFVLVVRAGITQKGAFERVYSELLHGQFSISGVVMNAMTDEHHSYGAGYYYDYYNYYYSEE